MEIYPTEFCLSCLHLVEHGLQDGVATCKERSRVRRLLVISTKSGERNYKLVFWRCLLVGMCIRIVARKALLVLTLLG